MTRGAPSRFTQIDPNAQQRRTGDAAPWRAPSKHGPTRPSRMRRGRTSVVPADPRDLAGRGVVTLGSWQTAGILDSCIVVTQGREVATGRPSRIVPNSEVWTFRISDIARRGFVAARPGAVALPPLG